MPRGKNYVNQNKGMRLQAPSRSSAQKQECKYGSACTRKDCIYRHTASKEPKSNDPCMAYLAGICSFTGKACRKRHPSDGECERLLQKYALRPCRFGEQCRTDGCLYNHDPKPVVVQRTAPANANNPGLRPTGPTLSTWMPTNTVPSASASYQQQLRPSAGSWQPSYPPSRHRSMQQPGFPSGPSTGSYPTPMMPTNPYQQQQQLGYQYPPQGPPPPMYGTGFSGNPAAVAINGMQYHGTPSAPVSLHPNYTGRDPWAPLQTPMAGTGDPNAADALVSAVPEETTPENGD